VTQSALIAAVTNKLVFILRFLEVERKIPPTGAALSAPVHARSGEKRPWKQLAPGELANLKQTFPSVAGLWSIHDRRVIPIFHCQNQRKIKIEVVSKANAREELCQNAVISLTPLSPEEHQHKTTPKWRVGIARANTYTFTGMANSLRKFVEYTN
jgi:hypothetical protein